MQVLRQTSLCLLFFGILSCHPGEAQSPLDKIKYEKITEIFTDEFHRPEEDWKRVLSKDEYYVLRKKGTERPFTGDLLKNKESGVYVCGGCGLELFDSNSKFNSGTGWPSFYTTINEKNVGQVEDTSYGMRRVEVICNRCKGHLGHVFEDGPKPTGLRYCINSVSLDFVGVREE